MMMVEFGREARVATRAVEVMAESSLVPDLWESSDDDDEDVVDTDKAAG